MTTSPPQVHRAVLDVESVADLSDHLSRGGGTGLGTAQRMGPGEIVEEVEASGLRGRGGAGFPTGTKWRTVGEYAAGGPAPRVVVNGAEGEPGSFKDRALLRSNPYKVLEGAVIAARAVGASEIVVALKSSFRRERERVEAAVGEVRAEGWFAGTISVATGPSEYLFGEETALLEVLAGRPPFPRVAPPFRRAVDAQAEAATATFASEEADEVAAAALVDNVETLANVPMVLAHGPDAFRRLGTAESPGSLVCTVTGGVRHPAVGEVAMGTPISEVISRLGGGPRPGRDITGVLPGVSGPVVTADRLDTPLTYEAFEAAGSSLGAGAFIVLDDGMDPLAIAAQVARFLAVESCGQCRPCKVDGLEVAAGLAGILGGVAGDETPVRVRSSLATVADGARCFLAHQTQQVVGSLLDRLVRADAPSRAVDGGGNELVVAPLADLDGGRVSYDTDQTTKQPDWTHDATDSGVPPVERLGRRAAPPG